MTEAKGVMGILQVIKSPIEGMRSVSERGALPGFVTILLWTVVSLLASGLGLLLRGFLSAEEVLEGLPPGTLPQGIDQQSAEGLIVAFQFVGIGLNALWPLVYWAILTLVMYIITRFFGGERTLSGMFGAMGAACVPFVISGLLQLPITGVQVALGSGGGELSAVAGVLGLVSFLLTLAALVWHVALVIVGSAVARSISYGKSGGSCAISCATVVSVPLLLLILLSIILAATGAGSGG